MQWQRTGPIGGFAASRQIQLNNKFRELWFEHVMWTRSFLVSAVNDLKDLDAVTQRLLRNPADFADALRPIYGRQNAAKFESLLTDHLKFAAALVNAVKAGNSAEADAQRKKWYENADDIAAFLSGINPYWNEAIWRELLYDHLRMIENEVGLLLTGQYDKSIELFDEIQREAMEMADYMVYGILKQTMA